MRADTNAPMSTSWPRTVKPRPSLPPPPAAFTSGVTTVSVNALTSVLNASAIERPTATTTSWPCMRKFLKPRMGAPFRTTVSRGTIRLEPVERGGVVAEDEARRLLRLLRGEELRQHFRERPTPPARREVVELGRSRRVRCVEELRHGGQLERLA